METMYVGFVQIYLGYILVITNLFKLYLYLKYAMLCKARPRLYLNNVQLYLGLYISYVRLYIGYT
jgi:hypothetical protein